ncbi:MAG: hypothetical protein KIT24_10750 [Phycisphaeraceae bacterium]|nr:hypothetical protein [Phycisphaeraceae bacterium]
MSLIELLVVIAISSLLLAMVLPALGGARESARGVRCASNLRQMAMGWMMYAGEHGDRAMPLAYWELKDIGSGPQIFWWGSHGTATDPPDHAAGFLAPYLESTLNASSVYECPNQPWETYRPQGPSRSITSTYGYNGYYLSPGKTPGWASSIGHRPWRRIADVEHPSSLFVFADALLGGFGGGLPMNTALLDPPMLYMGGQWRVNDSPTTAFRHRRHAQIAAADGSVQGHRAGALMEGWDAIGSVTVTNSPGYVPDWRRW